MKSQVSASQIKKAAIIIRKGGIVVFPTETVYGIGADAFNPEAVKRIFKIKGRPESNPMTIHISKISDVKKIARDIPLEALKLIKKCWPGPLTIVLNKKKTVPDLVTAGKNTVGIRMPDHPAALLLIRNSKKLIAAPSANISGQKSPCSIKEIPASILKNADYVLNAGRCRIGIPSTIADFTVKPPRVLRKGALVLPRK